MILTWFLASDTRGFVIHTKVTTNSCLFTAVLTSILCVGLLIAPAVYAVPVAVIDSGVNPSYADLAGRIDPGIDLIDGDNNPFDTSPQQHGTTVSRIIASVHGDNRILPIRVLDASGVTSESVVANGISYATSSGARIINLSLGSPTNTSSQAMTNSIQDAALAGKLVVMAAGNSGLSNPAFPASLVAILGGSAIAVGALDASGRIASYSNRAGNSREYYIVAPGYSGFSSYIGTSFATPYVSGTAAGILSQNPRLNAQQVAEIILNSADDLGAPGTDEIYGRGKLNIAAALAPQGDIGLADSSDDGNSALLIGGLVIGVGVAAAIIIRNRSLKEAVVVDSYDRPYQVDLGEMIEVRDDGLTLVEMMKNLRRVTEMAALPITDRLQMAVWYDRRPQQELYAVSGGPGELETVDNWSMSLQHAVTDNTYYALNLNLDPRQFFGLTEQAADVALFDRGVLTAPYAGFASNGNTLITGYQSKQGTELKLGIVHMDDDTDFGVNSQSLLLEANIQPHHRLRLGLQFSGLDEEGSLFGGSSSGALSVNNAGTLATGLTARLKINNSWSLHSIYSQGLTWVRERNKGLLQQFTALRSSSYALGLSGRSLISKKDRLSLTVSSPLHIDSGELSLSVPSEIDYATGAVQRQAERIDLASASRETEIELGYHLPLDRQSGLAAYMLYRSDANGLAEKSTRGRYGAMMSVSTRF